MEKMIQDSRCQKTEEKKKDKHRGAARLHASVEVLKLKRQRRCLEISDFDIVFGMKFRHFNKFIQFVGRSLSISISLFTLEVGGGRSQPGQQS